MFKSASGSSSDIKPPIFIAKSGSSNITTNYVGYSRHKTSDSNIFYTILTLILTIIIVIIIVRFDVTTGRIDTYRGQ